MNRKWLNPTLEWLKTQEGWRLYEHLASLHSPHALWCPPRYLREHAVARSMFFFVLAGRTTIFIYVHEIFLFTKHAIYKYSYSWFLFTYVCLELTYAYMYICNLLYYIYIFALQWYVIPPTCLSVPSPCTPETCPQPKGVRRLPSHLPGRGLQEGVNHLKGRP